MDSKPPFRVVLQRDCFGGERIVDVQMPRPVEERHLQRIEGVGASLIMRSLPRPYFRVDVPGRFTATGILSDPRIRFTVRLAIRDHAAKLALDTVRIMMGEE